MMLLVLTAKPPGRKPGGFCYASSSKYSMRNHAYTKNEYRAIHDFLVEQSADICEYLEEARQKYEQKPSGSLRMDYQWARRIKGYVDFLLRGVQG